VTCDRLDNMAAWAEAFLTGDARKQVLALVNIAKAARLIAAHDQAGGNDWWEAHAQLYGALAALGEEAAP
jgi:hypothetical protein